MSLKQEIETWVKALDFYDRNEFDESLGVFQDIADTSKIQFNCGVIHATLGEHEQAVRCYESAIKADKYMAVSYFQQGVSNFLMGDFEEALANFNDTLLYLRGNKYIDYQQLGLKFKLYSCEVLFNRGLCYIYLQQIDQGMQDLSFAVKEKAVPDHDVIEEAIREQAEGYTVFSIPVGVVYRPNEAKVKNLRTKDYLGKAKLVATVDRSNAFTGFQGAELKRMNSIDTSKDDRPTNNISYAASNLVKSDIRSRNRQNSEPGPGPRDVFPPTPPPDSDKAGSRTRAERTLSRGESVRAGPRPRPLDLSVAGFERPRPGGAGPNGGRLRSQSDKPLPTLRGERPDRSDRRPSYASTRSGSYGYDDQYDDRPRGRYNDRDRYNSQYGDGYDTYGRQSMYNARKGSVARTMISEEGDYGEYDEPDFDMMSRSGRSQRGAPAPRAVSVNTVRVKVHADDTRYIMLGAAVEYRDMVDAIRKKFGIQQNFIISVRDDGDMITMSDQDDLDMALLAAVSDAKRDMSEVGRMEIWIEPAPF